MKLLYLHDLNKTVNAVLVAELQKSYTVITPELNREQMSSPDYLDSYIRNMLGEDFIVMGEGLGAYWASYFADIHELFGLYINPCRYPRVDHGIRIKRIEDPWYARSYILIDAKNSQFDWVEPEDTSDPEGYYVMHYNNAEHTLVSAAKNCLDDLAYWYRTRAYPYSTRWNHKEPGALGDKLAAKIIRKHLFEQDPMNTGCVVNNDYGIYDFIAPKIADDLIFDDITLEESLTRRLTLHFGDKPDSAVIQQLAQHILKHLPEAVHRPSFPFQQKERDLGSHLSSEQVNALSELNDKLIEIEKDILPKAVTLDAEYQQKLANPNDPLSKYDLVVYIGIRLQEDDVDWDRNWNNFMTVSFQIATGCSNDKEAFLQRLNMDHNDLPANHPLCAFKHSWLFHYLYGVSNIRFADLLRIGFVWADIRVQKRHKLSV